MFLFCSCAYDLCYASEIMSIADAMATNGMKELGYEYINLDGMYIVHVHVHVYSTCTVDMCCY